MTSHGLQERARTGIMITVIHSMAKTSMATSVYCAAGTSENFRKLNMAHMVGDAGNGALCCQMSRCFPGHGASNATGVVIRDSFPMLLSLNSSDCDEEQSHTVRGSAAAITLR